MADSFQRIKWFSAYERSAVEKLRARMPSERLLRFSRLTSSGMGRASCFWSSPNMRRPVLSTTPTPIMPLQPLSATSRDNLPNPAPGPTLYLPGNSPAVGDLTTLFNF
jgi:hypothetical protein